MGFRVFYCNLILFAPQTCDSPPEFLKKHGAGGASRKPEIYVRGRLLSSQEKHGGFVFFCGVASMCSSLGCCLKVFNLKASRKHP